ncbi:MAG: XdhC/CoxI family protein [Gemmatimonadota bacterium]
MRESNRDVIDAALTWQRDGRRIVLATVIATWGSAPRQQGAQMCIDDSGRFVGSVSGGCVEGAVIHHARELMVDGGVRSLRFGVSDAEAWEVGLACGGTVEIWLHASPPASLLERMAGHVGPLVLVSRLDSGEYDVVDPSETDGETSIAADLRDAALVALADDRSTSLEHEGVRYFLHVRNRTVRVLIVGATHLAQSLTRMVRAAGFDVVVIDPRRDFNTEERFPGVAREFAWPEEAIERCGIDERTAVVTTSHDPKLDDPSLRVALESSAFYIGALGSRRTHEARTTRLLELGFDPEDVSRIHAPIGLDIGSRSPGEIAASVVAEIIQSLRQSSP